MDSLAFCTASDGFMRKTLANHLQKYSKIINEILTLIRKYIFIINHVLEEKNKKHVFILLHVIIKAFLIILTNHSVAICINCFQTFHFKVI